MKYTKLCGPAKVTGTIASYTCTRGQANFVYSGRDQNLLGTIARAAALATASSASDMEEEADHVDFMLGDSNVKGWVWRSPFKNGDHVEVVAEWQDDHYVIYGIARPSDRMIALYPHCSRGRGSHIKNAIKWWVVLGLFTPSIVMGAFFRIVAGPEIFNETGLYVTLGIAATFFALMFASLAKKWMPFASLAETVFRTLGWKNAANVDLVASSKAQRNAKDPGEFGTFYFRY